MAKAEKSAVKTVAKTHKKDGITPDLVRQIMGVPADKPDSTLISNEEWDNRFTAWKRAERAFTAYEKWEATIVMVDNAFQVLRSHTSRENQRRIIIKFVPAAGGERVTDSFTAEQRQRRHHYPFYLLSKEMEEEGLALVKDIPGCPTVHENCGICKKPLFSNNGHLDRWLVENILEPLLYAEDVDVRNLRWPRSHEQCDQMSRWETKFRTKLLELSSQVQFDATLSAEEKSEAIEQLRKEWHDKGTRTVRYLKSTGYITGSQAKELDAHVVKVTRFKSKSKSKTKKGG